MMMQNRHLAFWLLTCLVLAGLLWLLHDVLLPFVAGLALAYMQTPLADRLERLGLNRTVAALLMVSIVVVALIALVVLLVPLLLHQGSALISHIPGYFKRLQEMLVDPSFPWLNWLAGDDKNKTVSDLVGQAASWLLTFSYSLWTGGKALVSFASILIVMPIVTFYLICDWHRVIEIIDSWVPVRQRDTVRRLAGEIDTAIGGFLRGQLGVCLILGVYYAVALMLVGLDFALLIGLVAGLITFVPYIGSMTGLMIATSVAIAQFWPDWKRIVVVVAIFLVGQFVEGNIVSPKLVGERVGLHPVWMMFAMFAFGYLFGFVGLLIAVPLAAAIAVLFRFGLRQYLASAFYSGGKPT
jgi:predicted PurR-regulated permease PerM